MKNSILIFLLVLTFNSFSQESSNPAPILFIYDASGSMWGKMQDQTKMKIATDILTSTIDSLSSDQPIGLMAYGHRREKDCQDVEFLAGIQNTDKEVVTQAIQAIKPLGRTPLAKSASMAIESVSKIGIKTTIILITDGVETCDGDLCKIVQEAKTNGIDFKLHIVGFGLQEEKTTALRCAAEAGDGQYFNANNPEALSEALEEAVVKTIDDPISNLSISATLKGEWLDALVRVYKVGTKDEVGTARTFRDTGKLFLPKGTYDLIVTPLENTDLSPQSIQFEMDESSPGHLSFNFDGSILNIYTSHNGEPWDGLVKVCQSQTDKVVAQTRTYGKTKSLEVDPGSYYILLEAMKIKGKQAKVKQDSIQLEGGAEQSIQHNFESGTLLIGIQTSAGERIDSVVKIKDPITKTTVASSRTYTGEKQIQKLSY